METTELLLLLLVASQAHYVIGSLSVDIGTESPSDTAYLEADEFLTSYGYYLSNDLQPTQLQNPSLNKHSDTERVTALRLFQKSFNLPQSGQLDKETYELMQNPRCGNPDITSSVSTLATRKDLDREEAENVSQTRKVNKNQEEDGSAINVERGKRSLDMSRKERVKRANFIFRSDGTWNWWYDRELRWKFTLHSGQMPWDTQEHILKKAMSQWEPLVPIKFVEETKYPKANMHIMFHSFASSSEDDELHKETHWQGQIKKSTKDRPVTPKPLSGKAPPIIGSKGRFSSHAHAMVPLTYRDALARDIHFNEDHNWTEHELFSFALHEIGHSLGLHHSFYRDSVMFPVNRGVTEFSKNDIDDITTLYSNYSSGRLRPPMCKELANRVDHIIEAPIYPWENIYAFIFGRYFRLASESEEVYLRSYNILQTVFPNLPLEFDVVFTNKIDTVSFIAGNKLYRYSRDAQYAFKLKRSHIPQGTFPERPKFAVTMDSERGELIILFGYTKWWYWEYDGKRIGIEVLKHWHNNFLKPTSNLLRSAKFAVEWTDGHVYVVTRNNSYFILHFNILNGVNTVSKVMKGRPSWMDASLCSDPSRSTRTPRPSLMLLIILALIELF